MTWRPLLIAERPPHPIALRDEYEYVVGPHQALDGPSGDRLAAVLDVTREDLLVGDGPHRVDAINLTPYAKGDMRWYPGDAEACAANLLPLLRGRRVVLLGRVVAAAFGFMGSFDGFTHYHQTDVDAEVWTVPHPSGKCRVWNAPAFRGRFRRWWHETLLPPLEVGMRHGTKLDLLAPDPEAISLFEVARVLSRECRWSGHTIGGYSVLQHSILTALLARGASPLELLACLVHDVPEALGLRDVASPTKRLLGPDYRAVERRLGAAFDEHLRRLGVVGDNPLGAARRSTVVRAADRLALDLEGATVTEFGGSRHEREGWHPEIVTWGLDDGFVAAEWVQLVRSWTRPGFRSTIEQTWATLNENARRE